MTAEFPSQACVRLRISERKAFRQLTWARRSQLQEGCWLCTLGRAFSGDRDPILSPSDRYSGFYTLVAKTGSERQLSPWAQRERLRAPFSPRQRLRQPGWSAQEKLAQSAGACEGAGREAIRPGGQGESGLRRDPGKFPFEVTLEVFLLADVCFFCVRTDSGRRRHVISQGTRTSPGVSSG